MERKMQDCRHWDLVRSVRFVVLFLMLPQGLFSTVFGQAVRANDAASEAVGSDSESIVLIRDGKPYTSIVYSDRSTYKARLAARKLRNFLARMTGVTLPVELLSEDQTARGRVLLGPEAARTAGIDIAQTYPGGERVVVKRVAGNLVIAGNDAQDYEGTVHAVVRFLEELGSECIGPDPDWHVVPKLDEVVVGDIDIDTSPAFDYRSTFFFSHPWKGSHPDFDGNSWCMDGVKFHAPHIYEVIVPYSLFDEHPDYFALVGGQRTARGAQICFSNPDVVSRAVKAARAHFDNDPAHFMFSLTANDTKGFCECPGCKELGDNPGGQTMAFANLVARELRKTHPDKELCYLAYLGTADAPKRARPDPGQQVMVVNETCKAHSLDHESCPDKKSWKENLDSWRTTGVRVEGIYEYYMTAWGGWKHIPAILGDAALRDLRYYKARGIKYMYYEGAERATIEDSPIQWPLHYVVARGTWDPELTARQILEPACQRLFGKAAEPMLAFYLECARALEACSSHSAWWGLPNAQLVYTPEVVTTLRASLGKAMQAGAEESPEVLRRIFDVVECWRRAEQRLGEIAVEAEYPKVVANAIHGQPGMQFRPQDHLTIPTVPGASVPSGNYAFTVFFVGTVKRKDGMHGLLTWGNPYGVSQASIIQINDGRLDWATGWGEDAVAADKSFNAHFDRPLLICIRKTPGPINQTTSVWINGRQQALSEKSSARVPDITATDLSIGGTFFGTDMVVGEVLFYDRALTDETTDKVGSYLAKKFGLPTDYSDKEPATAPDAIDGLCAWFKVDGQAATDTEARPPVASRHIVRDSFDTYRDGGQLRADLGKPRWCRVLQGPTDHQLKAENGMVQRFRASSLAQGAFATSALHEGQAYARVQVDFKYSAFNNANRAGVFLNATKWERGNIGQGADKNLYRVWIDNEGFFFVSGHNEATDKHLDSGRQWPKEPLEFDKWFTVILEARYAAGQVTLDVTIKRAEDGQIIGTYQHVDTEVLLHGGAAGLAMNDAGNSEFRLDNFELEYGPAP